MILSIKMIAMKFCILFFLLNFLSQRSLSQDVKFYINGSNIKDSTFPDINDGDLLRVIFINKSTGYKFLILHVPIILIPIQTKNNNTTFLIDTTEFSIANPQQNMLLLLRSLLTL